MSTTDDAAFSQLTGELDAFWLMFGAILVFFMQAGFAMLEVGSVNVKNTQNILLKNVCDASIGALVWWVVGYGIAMGKSPSQWIGVDHFALKKTDFTDGTGYTYAFWLFQWAFAATTATIVSGAVAERVTFTAYVIYAVCLTGFIYPMVASWAWNVEGFASAWRDDDLLFGCGVTDFAGSGVVHMTGGVAALVASAFLGPRKSFVDGTIETPVYGPVFQTLGVLILWFGWYGFNGVSTLYIVNYAGVAAKTMVTTTISAGTAALFTLVLGNLVEGKENGKYHIRLSYVNNGVLAGLVAITAGCSTCEPYGAFCIGAGAAPVYVFSSRMLKSFGIDDVVDASPVHGFCGAYGVIMAAFFATQNNYSAAYYSDRKEKCAGVFYGGDGNLLAANVVFVLLVLGWTGVLSCIVFGSMKALGILRVSSEVEEAGMDASEHGVDKGEVEIADNANVTAA